MDFDPYDPVDPLGQNVPFEMKDPSPDMVHPEDLKLASDQVLRRAKEQATISSPVVRDMISEELNRRELGGAHDEFVEFTEERHENTEDVLPDLDSNSEDSSSSDEDGYTENYTESYISEYKE